MVRRRSKNQPQIIYQKLNKKWKIWRSAEPGKENPQTKNTQNKRPKHPLRISHMLWKKNSFDISIPVTFQFQRSTRSILLCHLACEKNTQTNAK
jgi:hypothetical protein